MKNLFQGIKIGSTANKKSTYAIIGKNLSNYCVLSKLKDGKWDFTYFLSENFYWVKKEVSFFTYDDDDGLRMGFQFPVTKSSIYDYKDLEKKFNFTKRNFFSWKWNKCSTLNSMKMMV